MAVHSPWFSLLWQLTPSLPSFPHIHYIICTYPTGMAIFHNDSRISKVGIMHKLVPKTRDYEFPLCTVTISAVFDEYKQAQSVLKQALLKVLYTVPTLTEYKTVITEQVRSVQIVVSSHPSIQQLFTNCRSVAMEVTQDDTELVSPCECLSGPLSQYVDINVGHVCTTDMSVLAGIHPDLTYNHIGNNVRVMVEDNHTLTARLKEAYTAFLEVIGQILPDTVSSEEVITYMQQTAYTRLFVKYCTLHLKHKYWAGSDDEPIWLTSEQYAQVDVLREQVMVTNLDKIASAMLFVCKKFAKSLIARRLTDGPYDTVEDSVLTGMITRCKQILLGLQLSDAIPDSIPYMYPILKLHKCPQHCPRTPHDCKFEWRFIQSAHGCFVKTLATLVASIFKATFASIETKRDQEAMVFYSTHGFKLRFRFGIDAWQTVVLNLPSQVPHNYTLHIGDIVDAFPSLPLHGEYGVYEMTRLHVLEAFQAADRAYLAVPVDKDGVIRGKSKFVRSEEYSNISYGLIHRHILLDAPTVYSLIRTLLDLDTVGSKELVVKPRIGVPIGGPASSYLLEATVDQWEYRAAQRVASLADSSLLADRRLARRLAACLKWYWRYADDILSIAEQDMQSLLWNPTKPGSDPDTPAWIYPMQVTGESWSVGIKPSIPTVSAEGMITDVYLCLEITLQPPVESYRLVSYTPYSKRRTFRFTFPMLTLWWSATSRAVKLAAMDTMVQYAILGSTDMMATRDFLQSLVDRLIDNGYPKQVLHKMWSKTAKDTLPQLPCRHDIYYGRKRLVSQIHAYISCK